MSLMDKINDNSSDASKDVNTEADDGTIKVPTGMLEQLQKQIEEQDRKIAELQKSGGKKEEEDEDEDDIDTTPEARFRIWDDGKICIGFNKERGIWKTYNKERREDVLMQEIVLRDKDGKTSTMEVSAKEFAEEAREIKLPILEIKSKPSIEKKGFTTIKMVSKSGYRTVNTGKKVRQIVTSLESKALVEMPDGEQVELDINFLNM